ESRCMIIVARKVVPRIQTKPSFRVEPTEEILPARMHASTSIHRVIVVVKVNPRQRLQQVSAIINFRLEKVGGIPGHGHAQRPVRRKCRNRSSATTICIHKRGNDLTGEGKVCPQSLLLSPGGWQINREVTGRAKRCDRLHPEAEQSNASRLGTVI